jgi:branched-chain amino acid transport system substrate-binding protein
MATPARRLVAAVTKAPRDVRRSFSSSVRVAVLSLAAGLFSGCPGGTRADAPIVIGLIAYPTWNDPAAFGPAMVQAATLAADEVNRNGGLALATRDEGSNGPRPRGYVKLAIEVSNPTPEAAVAAANRLINQENVVAIVGPHWSREALPVSDVAERSRIPLISTGSTHPHTTEGKRYVFRIPFSDTLQGRVLAIFARAALKAPTAAVLYDASDPYTGELAGIFSRAFEANGGRLVSSETYTPDARGDYAAQLTRIAKHQPSVLFLPNLTEDAIQQVRQARALGIRARVLGSDMWRPSAVSADLDGAFFTKPEPFHDAGFNALSAAFRRRFGATPDIEAVETYDAFGLIFAAIRFTGDASPDGIRQGLYAMGPYQGVSGMIDYTNDGSPARSLTLLEVHQARAVARQLLRGDPPP